MVTTTSLLHLAAQLHGDQGRGVEVHGLVDSCHNAQLDELLDDLGGGFSSWRLASSPTVISSGILTTRGAFLAISSWSPAHFFLLLAAALIAEVALPLIVAALLAADTLLAAGNILQPLRDQRIDAVVEARGIDRDRRGVDHAAFPLALLHVLGRLRRCWDRFWA